MFIFFFIYIFFLFWDNKHNSKKNPKKEKKTKWQTGNKWLKLNWNGLSSRHRNPPFLFPFPFLLFEAHIHRRRTPISSLFHRLGLASTVRSTSVTVFFASLLISLPSSVLASESDHKVQLPFFLISPCPPPPTRKNVKMAMLVSIRGNVFGH